MLVEAPSKSARRTPVERVDGAIARIQAARAREREALTALEARLREFEQQHVHARRRLEAFEQMLAGLRPPGGRG